MTQAQEGAGSIEGLLLQHMIAVNKLCVKAYQAGTKESLAFIILNDSIQAIRYERAVLWEFSDSQIKFRGVSGHSHFKHDTELVGKWKTLIEGLTQPQQSGQLIAESFADGGSAWKNYEKEEHATVTWLPIFAGEELVLGLWIEHFGQQLQPAESRGETLKFLAQFLLPAYGAAWKKLSGSSLNTALGYLKTNAMKISLVIFFFLLIVRIPLRIVAPCEVVAKDPVMITAPLEGIVENVSVNPGQSVKKDDILYQYDSRLAYHNLLISKKEVEIYEEELRRARTLGLNDQTSLKELGELNLKLEKEKVNLQYVEWQTTQLIQKAPSDGVVFMDNPDRWRGKPVKLGERVMTLNNPANTKLKIWIPEDDNVVLDPEKYLKVFLNVTPSKSYEAHLVYIANESSISDLKVPSFLAEAEWEVPLEEDKLGLKGTVILYGERVSLFYYLIRKPLGILRRHVGI